MLRLSYLFSPIVFSLASCSAEEINPGNPIISLYSICSEYNSATDQLQMPKLDYDTSESESSYECVLAKSKVSTSNYKFVLDEYDIEADKVLEHLSSDIAGYENESPKSYPLELVFDSQNSNELNNMTKTAIGDSPLKAVLVMNGYVVAEVVFFRNIDVSQIEISLDEFSYSHIVNNM